MGDFEFLAVSGRGVAPGVVSFKGESFFKEFSLLLSGDTGTEIGIRSIRNKI